MRVFPQPGGPVCVGIKPPFPFYTIPPMGRAQFIFATNLLKVTSTAFREAILTLALQFDLAPLRGGSSRRVHRSQMALVVSPDSDLCQRYDDVLVNTLV